MKYNIPKLEKPENGRRIAIGDIHGCISTFKALINQLEISETDQIFLLGDLIDKGSSGKEVVDYAMELNTSGFQIYAVRGNHEQNFLTAYNCGFDFFEDYLLSGNRASFLEDDPSHYLEYFSKMEYCYDLGDWLVCHSYFATNERSLYRTINGLFPKIKFEITSEEILSKNQIVGHTTTTVKRMIESAKNKEKIICIDSGCVYDDEGMGYLTAFDLDSYKFIFQENIE